MLDGVARVVPDWFGRGAPITIARAPARLDVMGGIADYSGATVLQLPLALAASVAVQPTGDGMLRVRTDGPAVPTLDRREVALPLDALLDGPPEAAPEQLRAALAGADALWAAYPLGPLAILRAQGLLPAVTGLRIAVWSEVPAGAGISSSAALEVAALRAFCAVLGVALDPLPLALAAQQAEHRVALAPCGIMDQATSVLGHRDHLLMLRCQPAEVRGHRRLPRDVRVLGIDSGVAHRVAGHQYGRVRTAAFMGRAMIARIDPADPPDGYLCNLSPERFLARYREALPEELDGDRFLARFGETGDGATRVDPAVRYRVRDCATHPIMEQRTIDRFLDALDRYDQGGDRAALVDAGAAMLDSHESYGRRCGLGTPETDLLVELVRQRGADAGLFGARITGGGGGGTIAVLGAGPGVREAAEWVAAEYSRRSGNPARVIAGSGPGALDSPVTVAHSG